MLKPFEYLSPDRISDAAGLLLELGGRCKAMAGGTDVLVAMHAGKLEPEFVLDLKNIAELQFEPFVDEGGLTLSALSTHDEIERLPIVRQRYSALADAVSKVGSVQTRTRGTIGGNICNAAPSGDTLGPLLAYGAVLNLYGPEGERKVALEDFYSGAKKTTLKPGELLVSIFLPATDWSAGHGGFCSAYTKFSRRKAMDLALLGVTVCLALSEDGVVVEARIALTTAAPVHMRAKAAEEYLTGKKPEREALLAAGKLASQEARPRSSFRAQAGYRHALIEELVPRTAIKALKRITQAL